MNQRVLRIGPEDDKELKKELEREAAENEEEIEDEEDDVPEISLKKKTTTEKKKPQKKRKERSLKKQIAEMGIKLKAEFQAKEEEDTKDSNKKKSS